MSTFGLNPLQQTPWAGQGINVNPFGANPFQTQQPFGQSPLLQYPLGQSPFATAGLGTHQLYGQAGQGAGQLQLVLPQIVQLLQTVPQQIQQVQQLQQILLQQLQQVHQILQIIPQQLQQLQQLIQYVPQQIQHLQTTSLQQPFGQGAITPWGTPQAFGAQLGHLQPGQVM
jgi:Tfp pilus assembly protein PilN